MKICPLAVIVVFLLRCTGFAAPDFARGARNPANRFELSRGSDLVPEPEPRSGPINFLIYPLLEVDGKPVKVEAEFAFHRTKS